MRVGSALRKGEVVYTKEEEVTVASRRRQVAMRVIYQSSDTQFQARMIDQCAQGTLGSFRLVRVLA